jgi:hypothetical protein
VDLLAGDTEPVDGGGERFLKVGGKYNYTSILRQEINSFSDAIISEDPVDILQTIRILNDTYRNWDRNLL